MTTDTVSSFADLDQLELTQISERCNLPTEVEPEPALSADIELTFRGSAMAFGLRSDVATNQFLVTGMIRGLASNLQFARVSAEDKLDDMQTKAQARMQGGESELDHPENTGLTDAQQIFAESLLEQLTFIEDLFVDLRTFWAQSNDNPEFRLLNRTDIEVRQGMRAAAERKAAALASQRRAGAVHAIGDIAARRAAIAARRK